MTAFDALPAGHQIGSRYGVEERIGTGRFSAVYRARDERTQSRVALKILDPFLAQDPVHLERFRREVEILRALAHPHVIQLYDFIEDGPLRVIVMQWVDGADAAAFASRHGPLDVPAFLRIAQGIASALEACARAGVLHRDLKPQNVLVDPHGEARLADFGVSKLHTMSDLTRTGTAVGSPAYMAPELFHSSRTDPRSDLYSAGALFFELLAGRPPYLGHTLAGVLSQQLGRELPDLCELRPGLPRWLERIVRKCLQPDPNRRYASAAELAAELSRGQRALACYESEGERASCLHCEVELVPGLGFCHGCGRLIEEGFERGEHSLVLYRADRPALLAEQIARRAPGISRRSLTAALAAPPVLILGGVSKATAVSLHNELCPLFCELSIVRALPAELRLPRSTTVLGIGLLALGFAAGGVLLGASLAASPVLGAIYGMSVLGASLLAILVAYRRRVRPIVALRARPIGPPDREALRRIELARAVSEIRLPDVRLRLGELCARALAICTSPAVDRSDAAEVDALLAQCFEVARQLERCELYLGTRTRMHIAQAIEAVQMRIERATADEDREALVRRGRELREELAEFHATEQRHADSQLGLLAACAALERIKNALHCGEPCPELGPELRSVTGELGRKAEPAAG